MLPTVARGLADEVGGLVQPVGDGGERHVGPQPIDDLLTMHAVRGRQREQLDELGRIATAESRPVDLSSVDDHLEPPEQPHLDAHGRGAYETVAVADPRTSKSASARRQRSASSGWPARSNWSSADRIRSRAVTGSPSAASNGCLRLGHPCLPRRALPQHRRLLGDRRDDGGRGRGRRRGRRRSTPAPPA